MKSKSATLWVVVGATGTGKTEYSLDLAEKIQQQKPKKQAHIVNADSMQFYKGMNIGTAKIPAAKMREIPHHFFDVLHIKEEATVAWYQPEARKLILDLLDEGHDVILVGGSGLYISSVIYEFNFPARDEKLRAKLNSWYTREGAEPLLEKLRVLAPKIYEEIDKNNPRRVIRALEIAKSGQKSPTALPKKPELWYKNTKIIGLFMERAKLVEKLDARVIKMWQTGLLDEVRTLLAEGIEEGPTASKAIGYRQAISELKGELSTAEAIAKTQALTRRYARRQVSWFKRYPEVEWQEVLTSE